jgi:1-aminocyclopropane-1-carboxylate deaminase/D-cysteine desulfhydrase-like pyridoxal-dependent ACC family enzyme
VHVTATAERAEGAALVESVSAEVRAAGGRPFVIGVGGTSPVGAAGQVLAGLEVAEQLDAAGIGAATVILPSASGGTQAGVLTGLALALPPRRSVIGIAVSATAADLRPTIEAILDGLDEVNAERRSACLKAISVFRDHYEGQPIVVTCRLDDYRRLIQDAPKLAFGAAYVTRPLSVSQVCDYLAAAGLGTIVVKG